MEPALFTADDWEALAALVSIVGLLLAATAWWIRRRDDSLRRTDVHAWADRAIEALQSVVLIARLSARALPPAEFEIRRIDLAFKTSVLAEQGRLFFRNRRWGREGREKQIAYRGRRPAILDDLIVAHQACLELASPDADRLKIGLVAEDALKRFVSSVQSEVGRSRTASAATSRSGRGIDIQRLMEELDARRVDANRRL
ncbi:hypothetical protein [Phenylobacterium sp.]|uniref:hypothetical protein n=1 Tax=Phenylobacterium sp. TaxID=1871053 RepID=UPI000C8DE4EA|nr:hypothetical protein [Phenylobacterium sp.]MAK80631.1 hypothetical protein [Phenylobacterium sp.]